MLTYMYKAITYNQELFKNPWHCYKTSKISNFFFKSPYIFLLTHVMVVLQASKEYQISVVLSENLNFSTFELINGIRNDVCCWKFGLKFFPFI